MKHITRQLIRVCYELMLCPTLLFCFSICNSLLEDGIVSSGPAFGGPYSSERKSAFEQAFC